MKLTDLIVSPKSLGDKLWLVDVSPAYEYKDGKRTDTVLGYPCRTHQYGIWQSNDVYFVVIYYAIPAYYPELELQIVFLSGFNANHLYKAKSRKAWIIHRCLAVSLYLQMCYFREWSLTGQPTNIADDEH